MSATSPMVPTGHLLGMRAMTRPPSTQSIQDGKPSTDDDTVGPKSVEEFDDTEGNAEDDAAEDAVEADDAQAADDATEGDAVETSCATIADLRAAGEEPVDLTLCEVAVTVVYDSGYYVQELGGDAMNIYVGLQFNEDDGWPYAAPTVGDITVAVVNTALSVDTKRSSPLRPRL